MRAQPPQLLSDIWDRKAGWLLLPHLLVTWSHSMATDSKETTENNVIIRSWFSSAGSSKYGIFFLCHNLSLSLLHIQPIGAGARRLCWCCIVLQIGVNQRRVQSGMDREYLTIEDVQKTVLEARQFYESSKKGTARLWLSKFSSRVLYCGVIMGTISVSCYANNSTSKNLQILFHSTTLSMWVDRLPQFELYQESRVLIVVPPSLSFSASTSQAQLWN